MKNQRLVVCLVALSLGFTCFAQDAIETYGDSITAGFLTKTEVTNAPPLSEISLLVSDLAMFFMTKDTRFIVKHHAPDLAWPALLAKTLDPNGPLRVENQAVSGANTWELITQVRKQAGRSSASRAFFFIGHNDLCNNPDSPTAIASSFSGQVENALAEWSKTHRGATAYLVPISDIHRVYERLWGYVWHKGAEDSYTCTDSWTKLFPYCISHYKKAKLGQLETYMKPRLNEMNAALEKLADAWNRQNPANHYVYLKDAHNIPYEPEYFAVDCFHLSAAGQRTVATRIEEMVLAAERTY